MEPRLSLPLLLSLFMLSPAGAGTVGVNFVGNAGESGMLAAADLAGVVPAANWNNVSQSGTALKDSTGADSPITVSFSAGGWSNRFVPLSTPNHRLMKGYLDIGGTNITQVTIHHLDPSRTYTIYLYSDGENSSHNDPMDRTGTFTVHGVVTGITDAAGENFEGNFIRVYPGTTGEGNYTEITVSGSASYVISARGTAADGTDHVYRSPINAIQIVETLL